MAKRIRHGLQSPLPSTCAWTALPTIETLVFTSLSFDQRISTVSPSLVLERRTEPAKTDFDPEWQWDQLRLMKVGGNESATKFFQQNGGTAALNSKDSKTKYQSNAATKYKDELKRRSVQDAKEYVNRSSISVTSRGANRMLDFLARLTLLT